MRACGLSIRFAEANDLKAIAVMEAINHPVEGLWVRSDLNAFFECDTQAILVAEVDNCIVGYLAYTLQASRAAIDLVKLTVAVHFRRHGVATALISHMFACRAARKLHTQMRALVRESNLPAQQLLRSLGFTAAKVARKHFGHEDGYLFTHGASVCTAPF